MDTPVGREARSGQAAVGVRSAEASHGVLVNCASSAGSGPSTLARFRAAQPVADEDRSVRSG